MVTLAEILKPRHVDLALEVGEAEAAVARLAELLQGDPRITNRAEFQKVLRHNAAHGLTVLSCGAVLCHARTEGVTEMLMAVGRLTAPIALEASGQPTAATYRYVFLVGLPPTMAAEYLRVVGALARTLKSKATMPLLDETVATDEFVSIMSRAELAL